MCEEVMFQKNKNDVWKSIVYFFSKMIAAKFNYEIYDKKLLIIVRVFEKWRSKLKEFKFFIEVISNHKNLEYFMFFKFFNRRQVRWFEFFFKFDFRIIYRSNKQNNAADVLSRQSEVFFEKKRWTLLWCNKCSKKTIWIRSFRTFII